MILQQAAPLPRASRLRQQRLFRANGLVKPGLGRRGWSHFAYCWFPRDFYIVSRAPRFRKLASFYAGGS